MKQGEKCPDCGGPWAKHPPGRTCECKGVGKGCQCQLDKATAEKEAEEEKEANDAK